MKLKKKDKRTNVQKEIDRLLGLMEDVRFRIGEDTKLDEEIERLLDEMNNEEPGSDEYKKMNSNLELLYKSKTNDKNYLAEYLKLSESLEKLKKSEVQSEKQFPWKELTVGVIGLIQIIVILKHEELNVISSKAFGMIFKGRA